MRIIARREARALHDHLARERDARTNIQILTIIYTYWGDTIRLISVRKATRYERNIYSLREVVFR